MDLYVARVKRRSSPGSRATCSKSPRHSRRRRFSNRPKSQVALCWWPSELKLRLGLSPLGSSRLGCRRKAPRCFRAWIYSGATVPGDCTAPSTRDHQRGLRARLSRLSTVGRLLVAEGPGVGRMVRRIFSVCVHVRDLSAAGELMGRILSDDGRCRSCQNAVLPDQRVRPGCAAGRGRAAAADGHRCPAAYHRGRCLPHRRPSLRRSLRPGCRPAILFQATHPISAGPGA